MKPNLGDVIADKYRLDRVLGEGGMSTVYAAANVLTGKQVAIKWLQPELIRDEEQSQRLLREAQATSAIDHPNVVNVFDIGRHDGALFLVMELLHGEPLSELLMRGAQEPFEFVKLMMPVLRGVYAAHRVGVVHRDLKPDNIFICRDPHGDSREPKVLDFGISKLANDALEPGLELTREGTVFGTPQYMAPEQMRDARSADQRSDVYALGVIFYRAFSNEYPYDADTLTALAIRIVEGNAAPLHELVPALDRGLSDVVMRALSLDPEQRFATVAAFAQALEPYANGLLFAPGASDRDSFPFPRRDSTIPFIEHLPSSRQIAPPPPPPRTGSMRGSDNPAAVQPESAARLRNDIDSATRLIDASDLIDEAEAPRRDSAPKLSIPPLPPPTPTLSRPSRGLEIVVDESYATHRIEQRGRKQSWGLGLALVSMGLLAPAGWQQWQKARGAASVAPARPAQPAFTGKTAHVYPAQALRPEPKPPAPVQAVTPPPDGISAERASEGGEQALAPGLAAGKEAALPPGAAGLTGAVAPRAVAPEPAQNGKAAAAPVAALATRAALGPKGLSKEELERRKRRIAPTPVVTSLSAAPESSEPAVAPEVSVSKSAAQQTERNPYLRH
ncbi:MAG: serine/threonine protein kinase [Myxococcaceae bacterium]|nr:serine/threonine protein kinase [Myxococcaceae bacterium]